MTLMAYSIGIDFGGTKLAIALVQSKGKIVSHRQKSILDIKKNNPALTAQKKIIMLMVETISELRSSFPQAFTKKNFCGVGLASAGPLNVETGCLINPINFPGWKTVPIQKMLVKALAESGLPAKVFFQNDAMAAALAEGWIGRAKKLTSYAVITVGTGIGSGVIFQGRPVQTRGMGSEFGHLIAENQNIHNPNSELHEYTIEGVASGTGILRRAQKLGYRGSCLEDLVQDLEQGRAQSKIEHQVLFDDAADALAALCYNLSIGFNLEKILFSGGLIKIRYLFFDRMKSRYKHLIEAMNPAFRTQIQIAKCSNYAGVIGAASLPLNSFNN
ncbi:MAG: ROK family protein [Bdellovibrionaceae bacterium]|nr:ROK family protein [Pseudobdellovibrionaceae bacterium]